MSIEAFGNAAGLPDEGILAFRHAAEFELQGTVTFLLPWPTTIGLQIVKDVLPVVGQRYGHPNACCIAGTAVKPIQVIWPLVLP